MYPVGGEKKRCVKTAQVKFNGMGGRGGVGYYAAISIGFPQREMAIMGSPKKKYLCLYFGISYLIVHSYLH